jgi:hypothetical protein
MKLGAPDVAPAPRRHRGVGYLSHVPRRGRPEDDLGRTPARWARRCVTKDGPAGVGKSRTGHATAKRLWVGPNRCGSGRAAERPGNRSSASSLPGRRLNDRVRPRRSSRPLHLDGPAWAKTGDPAPRSFTFLDPQRRLANWAWPRGVVGCWIGRVTSQPWRLSGEAGSAGRGPCLVPRSSWQDDPTCQACRRPGAARGGVRAAWWSASTAWRGCSKHGTGR